MSEIYIKKSKVKGLVLNETELEEADIRLTYQNIKGQKRISFGYEDTQITVPFEDIKRITSD